MAATGSNHKERHLAQLPGSFPNAGCRRGTRFPARIAAVLLVAVISVLVFPGARGEAAATSVATTTTTTVGVAAAPLTASAAVVVPILFPLEQRISWIDTFGASRDGGARSHEGNDLMVPKMTPLLAVVDGTVDWLFKSTGVISYYILLRGDDGNDYFYIHLNNDTPGTDDGMGGAQYAYAPGLTNGSRVKAGDIIGYAGDSGNAECTDPHLHFEVHPGGYKNPVNPYHSLKAAPTLAEWTAAGKPALSTWGSGGGSAGDSTTTTSTTSTTVKPPANSTTTTARPTTTTTTERDDTNVPGYTDVLTTDWFYADFAQAQTAGVLPESPDQRFRPYSKVSRALFAVYLVRAMAPAELVSTESLTESDPRFADVDAGHWAYNEIQTAARLGLIKGTGDGTNFSPDDLVGRAQMATMMCRALGLDINGDWAGDAAAAYQLYEDVPQDYWAQGAIVMVDYLGLMCGDCSGCFRPQEGTTRAQAITVMARLLRLLEGGSGS